MKRIIAKISSVAILAAAGGGLASALLSLLTGQKTTLAMAMGCLAPLPVMLATLSFGAWPGWIAAIIGISTVFVFGAGQDDLANLQWDQLIPAATDACVYAISVAIPAWWLSRIAAAARIDAPAIAVADERKLGLCIASAALFSVLGVSVDLVNIVLNHGGFAATVAYLTAQLEPLIQTLLEGRDVPAGVTMHDLARIVTWAQMPILSAELFVQIGFNLWLAARITKASGRLGVPWPDLPRGLRVPRELALVLAVALGLTFAGGLAGMLALIAAGALGMAFAVQGIALIHDLTRGKTYRLPLLILVYFSAIMPWALAVYAVLGLGDAGFSFRDKPPSKPPEAGKTRPTNS